MKELKRDPTKYVRDRAKSRYEKASSCRICSTTESLDFHHFYSVNILISNWVKAQGLNLADVMEWRDQFIAEHMVEMYDETVTLCREHHQKLHSIYGSKPLLHTAQKQKRWVERQREKHAKQPIIKD